jgi:2',3'-cyclic-nucleotide 2'-phosphodiesterase (5'-nucleotidase family)
MSPRVLHYSDLENAFDTPERVARVASCLRQRDGGDSIVVGSGDNTGPGVLSLVTRGSHARALFDAVDTAVETVGNHDLDHGPDAFLDVVAETPQQWVLANVTRDGDPFGANHGVEPWTVVDVSGKSVGFVGVVDEATPDMTPGLGALTFHDPVAAAADAVDELGSQEVDAVVVLAHTRTDAAEEIARFPRVDAVLAGHKHEPLVERIDGTALSRPGATGNFVHEVDLETGDVNRYDAQSFAPDERVRATLESQVRANDLDEVVAEVTDPIHRDHERRLDGEWRLGNFVADAYRWATDADVGLQNAGGIREGPSLSGQVTKAELVGVSPFEEPVVVAEVSGDELERIAHEADGSRVDGLPDYWWGHVSGMAIATNGAGFDVTVDGSPIRQDGTYRVAMPRYLLVTDREFPTLDTGMQVDAHELQYEVLVSYAREHGMDPSLDGRIPGEQ